MEKNNTNKEVIVFLDNIGRTVIGKKVSETKDSISVENPALVHINTNTQTNQIQLQLLPLFFKEFLSDKSESSVWNFNKASVTLSEKMSLAAQFINQYEQIFVSQPQSSTNNSTEVVRLFDDEQETK